MSSSIGLQSSPLLSVFLPRPPDPSVATVSILSSPFSTFPFLRLSFKYRVVPSDPIYVRWCTVLAHCIATQYARLLASQCRLSVCLSVCNALHCGYSIHPRAKVSEQVNRKCPHRNTTFNAQTDQFSVHNCFSLKHLWHWMALYAQMCCLRNYSLTPTPDPQTPHFQNFPISSTTACGYSVRRISLANMSDKRIGSPQSCMYYSLLLLHPSNSPSWKVPRLSMLTMAIPDYFTFLTD